MRVLEQEQVAFGVGITVRTLCPGPQWAECAAAERACTHV